MIQDISTLRRLVISLTYFLSGGLSAQGYFITPQNFPVVRKDHAPFILEDKNPVGMLQYGVASCSK